MTAPNADNGLAHVHSASVAGFHTCTSLRVWRLENNQRKSKTLGDPRARLRFDRGRTTRPLCTNMAGMSKCDQYAHAREAGNVA